MVATIRYRPNGSRNTTVPMMAPKITLVSRSAEIGASAPLVCAHSTRLSTVVYAAIVSLVPAALIVIRHTDGQPTEP